MGICANSNNIYDEDGIIADVIRKHGGIPFVKSNIPQQLGMAESLNRVYGNVKNPLNLERSAGGSSGGEAALLASRCSPIGIGTDAAGSIRIPSSFCGVYGFKPSVKRMTRKGVQENSDWQLDEGTCEIMGTTGPLGHCVDDLVEIMRIFLSKDVFEQDIHIPHIPFDNKIYSEVQDNPGKIRLGYFSYDGLYDPVRTAKRGMEETIDACKKIGIEMVEIDLDKFGIMIDAFGYLMMAAGNYREKLRKSVRR